MAGFFPSTPLFPSAETDAGPAREWVMPALIPRRAYARTCVKLPPGMPDRLEVHVVHSEEGIERSTAVVYGARAYLVHYEFRQRT